MKPRGALPGNRLGGACPLGEAPDRPKLNRVTLL
jgi:hypothetical protein